MKTVIDAIVGVLMLLGIGAGIQSIYWTMKKEALVKVHHGWGTRCHLRAPLLLDTRETTRSSFLL